MPLIRVLLQIRGSFSFRRLKLGVDLCAAGSITFAELDASVQGWINPARVPLPPSPNSRLNTAPSPCANGAAVSLASSSPLSILS